MLPGIFRNRRHRESTILKAIENGAKTLFDIVAYTYAEVDRSLWFYASSNVRLHVDHLALQDKLPNVCLLCSLVDSTSILYTSELIFMITVKLFSVFYVISICLLDCCYLLPFYSGELFAHSMFCLNIHLMHCPVVKNQLIEAC